jgi:4'-phosphopantetheinyl transferase
MSSTFLEVWIADLESMGAIPRSLLDLLEPAEEERAQSFRLGTDRRRYLASRILLRQALSHLAGGNPREWRFITGRTGKVQLAQRAGVPPIDFNISHSENAVVVAISSSGHVGVDIECDRAQAQMNDDLKSAFSSVFSKRELAFLETLPEALRWQESLRLWTIKEAYAKLLGLGVHIELTDFDVTEARISRKINAIRFETYELKLHSSNYHLALAARPSDGGLEGPFPPAAIRIVDPVSLVH